MDQNIFKKFVDWSKLKLKIHASDDISFYFHEREIWWTSVGQNVGSEENGKNKNFERPVLILKKFNKRTFLGIPASSQLIISKYHYTFTLDSDQYCLNLSQIRTFSSKRLLRFVGKLGEQDFCEVTEMLKKQL